MRHPSNAPRSLVFVLALLVASPGAATGCAAESCTELACNDESVVSFPPQLVDGAYDLVLVSDLGTLSARCSDPGAAEAADNPPELRCDGGGFELDGHILASARELTVTVTQVSDGSVVADAVLVTLGVAEENTPNGPDCPPTCYVRNGQLLPDGQPD